MLDGPVVLGNSARSLARNPLGIIALFIVLVYGLACLVTGTGAGLTAQERLPMVYFLVCFPILVLIVFGWLVSKHSGKLFAPADFKNEDNYVRMQMSAVASLTAASAKSNEPINEAALHRIVDFMGSTTISYPSRSDGWRNQLLWVDDRPQNNIFERNAFEAVGLRFTLALNTSEALDEMSKSRFVAITSDMGRREGPREGYLLLDRLREQGDSTPLFFYAASNSPEHKLETLHHGGQGCTNNAQELFEMVIKCVIDRGGSIMATSAGHGGLLGGMDRGHTNNPRKVAR